MATQNSSYAVILVGGKQVFVRSGDIINAEILTPEETVSFEAVLTSNGDKVVVGAPRVEGVSVKGTVLDTFKGKKVRVATFKAKSNFHRVNGYRATLKRVRIDSI